MRKVGWLGIAAVLALAAGCDSQRPVSVASAAAATTTPAADSAPRAPQFYQATGPLVVEKQVDVAAQREGLVAKIMVEAGQRVRQGQTLAQLDDRQLSADRDAARADVLASEANLNNWLAESKVLESDYGRDEALWKAQLITAQQLEHSKHRLEAAKFQSERDRQNVLFTKAKLRSLELELEKTRIVAPFDGMVARRYVREGQKVAANDRLFWVTQTEPLRVSFTLPQEFAGKVKLGETVKVSAAGAPGQHEGKITLISPVVDPSSGTIEVRAQMEGAPAGLLPGMTVNVQVNNPR